MWKKFRHYFVGGLSEQRFQAAANLLYAFLRWELSSRAWRALTDSNKLPKEKREQLQSYITFLFLHFSHRFLEKYSIKDPKVSEQLKSQLFNEFQKEFELDPEILVNEFDDVQKQSPNEKEAFSRYLTQQVLGKGVIDETVFQLMETIWEVYLTRAMTYSVSLWPKDDEEWLSITERVSQALEKRRRQSQTENS